MSQFGCSQHVVEFYDRGGFTRIGVVDRLTAMDWGRVRDDMSFAHATVASPSIECSELLDRLEPNRHEMVVWRDGERVWEGPVSHIEYQGGQITVEARDVMYYAYRLAMRRAHPNTPWTSGPRPLMISRAMEILTQEFERREAEDPPVNVLAHVIGYVCTTNKTRSYKETPIFAKTVYEELDSLAQHSGLDYTTVGRRIILSDVRAAWYTTPTVTEADFMGEVSITAYGMQGFTTAIVSDGKGTYGEASIDNEDYYGHWEMLKTPTEEEPEEGAPTFVGVRQHGATLLSVAGDTELAKQAANELTGAYPVPVQAYMPQGSRLSPKGILQMKDLIPGARVPLRATLGAREFSVMQKLDKVEVKESQEGEEITVDLSAASLKDEAALVWTPEMI